MVNLEEFEILWIHLIMISFQISLSSEVTNTFEITRVLLIKKPLLDSEIFF